MIGPDSVLRDGENLTAQDMVGKVDQRVELEAPEKLL